MLNAAMPFNPGFEQSRIPSYPFAPFPAASLRNNLDSYLDATTSPFHPVHRPDEILIYEDFWALSNPLTPEELYLRENQYGYDRIQGDARNRSPKVTGTGSPFLTNDYRHCNRPPLVHNPDTGELAVSHLHHLLGLPLDDISQILQRPVSLLDPSRFAERFPHFKKHPSGSFLAPVIDFELPDLVIQGVPGHLERDTLLGRFWRTLDIKMIERAKQQGTFFINWDFDTFKEARPDYEFIRHSEQGFEASVYIVLEKGKPRWLVKHFDQGDNTLKNAKHMTDQLRYLWLFDQEIEALGIPHWSIARPKGVGRDFFWRDILPQACFEYQNADVDDLFKMAHTLKNIRGPISDMVADILIDFQEDGDTAEDLTKNYALWRENGQLKVCLIDPG